MVRKTLAPVLLLMAFATLRAAPVPDRPAPERPHAPPPTMASAEVGKDGELAVERVVVQTEMVPVQEEVVVGGQKAVRTRLVPRQVTRITVEKVDLKGVQAFGSDGKQIEAAKLADLLKKPTPVL